ncbi:hypothetical protein PG990_008744 [Apiospora arundinis]
MPSAQLSSLPVEIKIKIFSDLDSALSAHNLSMASKDFWGILKAHRSVILRKLLNQLIGPECVKLAFMASVAQLIDPNNGPATNRFLDTHMNHKEVPYDELSLDLVHRLAKFHRSIQNLEASGRRFYTLDRIGLNEYRYHHRIPQAYYVLEIFSHLYDQDKWTDHDLPSFGVWVRSIPVLTRVQRYLPWPKRFWSYFSEEEVKIVTRVSLLLYFAQSEGTIPANDGKSQLLRGGQWIRHLTVWLHRHLSVLSPERDGWAIKTGVCGESSFLAGFDKQRLDNVAANDTVAKD